MDWDDGMNEPKSQWQTEVVEVSSAAVEHAAILTLDSHGKFLCDAEQATLTFLHAEQVVCLHYDRQRQALFLNGHRVNDIFEHADLTEFLLSFKKNLLEHRVGPEFLRAFDLQLSQIFTNGVAEKKDSV